MWFSYSYYLSFKLAYKSHRQEKELLNNTLWWKIQENQWKRHYGWWFFHTWIIKKQICCRWACEKEEDLRMLRRGQVIQTTTKESLTSVWIHKKNFLNEFNAFLHTHVPVMEINYSLHSKKRLRKFMSRHENSFFHDHKIDLWILNLRSDVKDFLKTALTTVLMLYFNQNHEMDTENSFSSIFSMKRTYK